MGLLDRFTGSVPFTQQDIPPLTDKVILVTGGNIGLGFQSVLDLAARSPGHIYLGARSRTKAESAIKEIRARLPADNKTPITHLELDLSSFASIKTAAKTFLAAETRLDLLLLNAGVMALPPGLTADGYEIQFGTNHVGHALLTKLLLPVLQKTAAAAAAAAAHPPDVRVVVLSSGAHRWTSVQGIDFDALRAAETPGVSTTARYGQSKLANALWAREFARRCPQLTVVAVHPGVVGTNLFQSMGERSWLVRNVAPWFLTSVEVGVRNQLWASTAPKDSVESGVYYEPIGVKGKASKLATDDALAVRLWEWTEKELESVKVEARI